MRPDEYAELINRIDALKIVNDDNEREAQSVARKCQRVRDELEAMRSALRGELRGETDEG